MLAQPNVAKLALIFLKLTHVNTANAQNLELPIATETHRQPCKRIHNVLQPLEPAAGWVLELELTLNVCKNSIIDKMNSSTVLTKARI